MRHVCFKDRVPARAIPVLWVAVFGVGLTGAAAVAGTKTDPSRAAGDWPMFRGNASSTGVADAALPEKLDVLWTFEVTEPIAATAAVVDGVVYIGDDDGNLYALDLADGKERWRYRGGEPIRSSATVVDGRVFFGDAAGVFQAVDVKNGKLIWKYETAGEIISGANPHKDRIVFGSYDGQLYCLSQKDGKLLWSFQTEGRIHGTPAIAEGRAIVAGCDEHLHVVDLDSGKADASIAMGSVSGSSAAIVESMAFVGTYGHKVLGINWKDQSVVWTFEDPDRQFPYLASAAVARGMVVITGRDKRVRALDAKNGKQLWEFATQGRNDASPVIVGDRVYQPSGDGNLYVLELKSGKELSRFEAGAPMSASPAVANDRLVIGTEDGVVYCLGAKGEP